MGHSSETIKAFAELVLFSSSLEEKLMPPATGVFADKSSFSALDQIPELPGRPPGLSLNPSQQRSKTTFPNKTHLSNARARGLVLHFFANHELLALEIMALALLRWPDAPESFRKGIVQTMAEEQAHMRIYLARMRDLGVEFGEAPLNSFFWKCMRNMASPMEYAAAMSMTFEQANLDFSLHFESIFKDLGDEKTAEIMQRVRLEEVGHVKHGVIWFERWRPKANRLFKEWYDTLRFPITPARAKGLTFDIEGRKAAGLPDDFIEELMVHNQSKGRPPRVFMFNPGCEQEVEAGSSAWTPPKPIQQLTKDYEVLMALLAHKDDIVMTSEQPSVNFLKSLNMMGFETPEFVLHAEQVRIKERKIARFEPWGWSPAATRYFEPLKPYLLNPEASPTTGSNSAKESIFSKQLAAKIRENLNLDSVETTVVSGLNAVQPVIQYIATKFECSHVVFKAPFSSSGRGMCRIRDKSPTANELKWIENVITKHGSVIAEPWLEKIADLSAHADILPDGRVHFVGLTRFWTNSGGQYRGHIIGRMMDDFDRDTLQKWHHEHGWQKELRETVMRVGHEVAKSGYFGPIGIDAFVYRRNNEEILRPMIEINPRWSMGRVSLAISSQIAAKHCGLWIHLSHKDLKASASQSFGKLLDTVKKIQTDDIRGMGAQRLIHSGAFALNDPERAQQSLALLIVGRDLFECYDVLRKGGIDDNYLELRVQSTAGRNLS